MSSGSGTIIPTLILLLDVGLVVGFEIVDRISQCPVKFDLFEPVFPQKPATTREEIAMGPPACRVVAGNVAVLIADNMDQTYDKREDFALETLKVDNDIGGGVQPNCIES